MPRHKDTGVAANITTERAVREARRAKGPFVESDDPDSAPEPVLKGSRPTFHEEKMSNMADKYKPIPEKFQKYIIEKQPNMAKYKMVYNQEPDTRVLLLRFPNRRPDQPYCARTGEKPLEIRIKPKHGHIEVDIPIRIDQNWDVEKAVQYQHAMQKSSVLQQGGSYGLAGGLGTGAQTPSNKKPSDHSTAAGPSMETLLANPADANNKGHVMNKITLAGRIIPFDDTQSRYLCGVFRD
ncbi:MAG: hypothetical protein Q9224_002080, partial [Gallowayella concinna]